MKTQLTKFWIQTADFGEGLAPDPSSNPLNKEAATNPLRNLETLISTMIGLLTVIASLFFVLYFVMGGITWVTAGGDSSKIQKARDQMVQGVLGMIIIVASYGIMGLIGRVIGIDVLNPGQILESIVPTP